MNAKRVCVLVILSVLGSGDLLAQTNVTGLVTNWVKSPENIRMVHGQIYNTDKSTNWCEFRSKVVSVSEGLVIGERGWFKRINTEGLPPERRKEDREIGGNTPRIRFVKEFQTVVFTNYPGAKEVVAGQSISGRAMRTGNYSYYQDQPDELWDCGTSVAVPVVKQVSSKPN